MEKNIQILLETMLRCAGNCSGCALSSVERMSKSEMDWDFFKQKAQAVHKFLKKKNETGVIESISLFLGQGDHFLMEEEEIENFMKICSELVPKELIHKTVLLITASAIGKEKDIQNKMDLFFQASLKYHLPFFIQVVFDPKKINTNEKFKKIYMNNIIHFKEKCGMTELTVNLGNDLFEYMSPNEFHDWVKEYGFAHIEMNWVMSPQTQNMWTKHSQTMFLWLKELLEINALDHTYEINFIPFIARALNFIGIDNQTLQSYISQNLKENIYIDSIGNISLAQAGLVSNLISLKPRLETQPIHIQNMDDINKIAVKTSTNILAKIMRRKSCINCNFKAVCAQIGTSSWMDFDKNNNENCPWNIKDFLNFVQTYLEKYPELRQTQFNKNPIQDNKLNKENNATFEYFEEKVNSLNIISSQCDSDCSLFK